ncbi:uncharacterized protein K452DRAFT_293964 [Aplosporella prunicola CBS 121167]|uniref:Uncharacterized protein n=1 Tax=Aplosporella prunicola CBS 121167 TaxID=1176127 RepID=A0A6A6BU88_9PEZI|nr:uncharacterized protein K452DRAFT_293964 [Aplosporella prunicola CBS 121167]KAF2147570.1 hypothetical protein K452DRAFT_293964 [Aplosporella prunicola CBS 121167]
MTAPTPTLEGLPEEVLCEIAEQIEADYCYETTPWVSHKQDLCSLRLTSRAIAAKLNYIFAKQHFREAPITFTLFRLEQLVSIPRSTFAPSVKTVLLSTVFYSNEEVQQLQQALNGEGVHKMPHLHMHRRLKALREVASDISQKHNGDDHLHLLALALRNLKNLEAIQLYVNSNVDLRQPMGANYKPSKPLSHWQVHTPLSAMTASGTRPRKLLIWDGGYSGADDTIGPKNDLPANLEAFPSLDMLIGIAMILALYVVCGPY